MQKPDSVQEIGLPGTLRYIPANKIEDQLTRKRFCRSSNPLRKKKETKRWKNYLNLTKEPNYLGKMPVTDIKLSLNGTRRPGKNAGGAGNQRKNGDHPNDTTGKFT